MKIALVHDDLIQFGGAERVFLTLAQAFPEADLFTSMATKDWEQRIEEHLGKQGLRTSFMQKLPAKKRLYRAYFFLFPLAFESFDFSEYDLVISSSTRYAHGVITKPGTLHVCYMNSPGRMFWQPCQYFSENPLVGRLLTPFLSWLRMWDYTAAQRVEHFVGNSKLVQKRISRFYNRDAEVIYPYVDLERFSLPGDEEKLASEEPVKDFPEDYYLIVSRLVAWKKIDLAVQACNNLKLPLVVVGDGPDKQRLRDLAGPTVQVVGRLSDQSVVKSYQAAKGFIFPQEEDFGITPLEAMASGKPVLAYRAGGALETILPGETGAFFSPQTVEGLQQALEKFEPEQFDPVACRRRAERFGKQRFIEEIQDLVARFWKHQNE
ncbi:MAG: glycosyltransferase [Patescibacteria group bacterium]